MEKNLLLAIAVSSIFLAGCIVGPAPEPAPVNTTSESLVEAVEFHTPDGWLLPGVYYKPLGPINRSVVLLHELSKSKVSWAESIQTLQYSGFGVLIVDQRGHGESFVLANRTKPTFAQFQPEDFEKMVDDVEAFVKHLRDRRPDDKISLVGASIGANAALNYAARDKNVSSVVLLSPGIDYRGIKTINSIAEYGDRPLLLVASREDEYSAFSAKQLSEKASPGAVLTLQLLDKAGHGTQMLAHKPELIRQIRDWLAKN